MSTTSITEQEAVREAVQIRIDREIDGHRRELVSIRERLNALDAEVDRLSAAEAEAWSVYEKAGDTWPDEATQQTWDSASREYHKAMNALQRAMDRERHVAQQILDLQNPEVLEVREQTSAHMRNIRKEYKMAKETAKDQGVPEVYLNEAGNFRIGMDARLKSDLVGAVVGEVTKDNPGASLHVFSESDAMALLEKRGWVSFLDRKREIIAAKEAKKAESAAKREATARERAEAKAAKDKEKAEAKAASDAEKEAAAAAKGADGSKGDVVAPDFKTGGKKK